MKYQKIVNDYIIVRGSSIDILEMNVKSRMCGGFIPQGGIIYDNNVSYDRYCQAMIRCYYQET